MSNKENESFHEYDLDLDDGHTSKLEKYLIYIIVLGALSEIGQFILMVIK